MALVTNLLDVRWQVFCSFQVRMEMRYEFPLQENLL
jgi:hypothetical protein